MKKTLAILLIALMLFTLFQGALRESVVKADSTPIWPMFGYNAQHTGQCPYDTSTNNGTLKWKFKTDYPIRSSPAIAEDGTIYVGSDDDYLYAIDPHGTLKWKFKTAYVVSSSPAIANDGTIYVGSEDDYLYAINPDGTLKWKYGAGDEIYSSPAISEDGTIYVVALGGFYLYAINPDGTLKWKFETGDKIWFSPAISEDGTIYVGSWDHCLYAINPNGTLKWKCDLETYGPIFSSPSIGPNGTIYVRAGSSYYDDLHYAYLYAISPNGTLKWNYPLGYERIYPSLAIGPNGAIYGEGDDNYLYAINPNGTLQWKFETGDWLVSSPAISSDGTIYVGSDDNYLYAIDPHGTLKWKFKTDNYVRSSPAISSDGTIYVGSDDDYLYAIGGQGTYIITASAGPGGTIDPSGNVAVNYGDNQTFTITPDTGYHIKDVVVDSVSQDAIDSYTFEHVTANHTIEAQFEINTNIFPLHIPSGWSLISVPFDTDVSLLSCPLIYYFDGSAWLPETATLHPGRGYLVLSTTPSSRDVILTGTPHSSPFSLPSPGSWQLIGNPFASPCTLSSTSPILLIYFFDATSSTWQPADTNNLQPGMGYLVLTSSPGTFTFTLKP